MGTIQDQDKKAEDQYKDIDQVAEEIPEREGKLYRDASLMADEIAQSIIRELDRNPTPWRIAEIIADEQIRRLNVRTFIQRNQGREYEVGTYIYDHGIYVEAEKLLISQFHQILMGTGLDTKNKRYSGLRNDYTKILKDRTRTEVQFDENLVLYDDVVLDWDGFFYEREPYAYPPSPDLYIFHRIPWKIDLDVLKRYKDRTYDEVLEGFREETTISRYYEDWADKQYPLLLELTGYPLLAGKYPLKAMFVIWGDRDSGKTTFADLLVSLLGEENVVSIPIQDLASDQRRFSRVELYHKMANICDDLPDKVVQDVGWIKEITGESYIMGERKFRDPIYFHNYAKQVFLCNNPPIVEKADDAFWSRVVVIEFKKRFERNDGIKRAIKKDVLPKDAPKLLAFSLLAVRNAVTWGKFSFQDTPEDAKRKWKRRADSIFHFLETGKEEGWLVEDEGMREEAPFLYDLYVRFCASEMIDELSRWKFTERMGREKHRCVPDRGKRYYEGIKVLRDKLPDHLRGSTGLE
jgi:putative DNA primase/helicase